MKMFTRSTPKFLISFPYIKSPHQKFFPKKIPTLILVWYSFYMKRPQTGSTPKQYAYAQRRLNGDGRSKKEMALLSGFSPAVAENVKAKVENTEGYQNAIIELATKSNNLLLACFAEYQARGLKNFSNKDLNAALNAISGAWDRVEKTRAPSKMKTPEGNPLRAVFTKRVETQTAVFESAPEEPATATEEETPPVIHETEEVAEANPFDED